MGPKKTRGGQDIVLQPTSEDFKCHLQEGTSEVASTDKIFQMNFDFRDFTPKDVNIVITKKFIKIAAFSDTEDSTSEFDEEILIPERVLRETITVKMNKEGVLRISAPLQVDVQQVPTKTVSESVTTVTKVVEGSAQAVKSKATVSEQEEIEESGGPDKKCTFTKDSEGNVEIQTRRTKFTVPEDQVTDKPVFKKLPGSIEKYMQAYLKCGDYNAEEITVKVSKLNSMIRIEGKHDGRFDKRSFFKELPLPKGVNPEEIDVSLNEDGVLRLQATPSDKAPPPAPRPYKRTDSEGSIVLAPKRAKFTIPEKDVPETPVFKPPPGSIEKYMQAYLKCGGYTPEEVTVRVTKNLKLRIEGNHEGELNQRGFIKEMSLPKDVKPENVDCDMNDAGILRITATPTPAPEKPPATAPAPAPAPVEAKPPSKRTDSEGNIVITPKKVKFVKHEKDVPDTPVFKKEPNSIEKYMQAYLKCGGYTAEEITVKITKHAIARIEGKHDAKLEKDKRSFVKEVALPKGTKQDEVDVDMNDSGILRLTATTTEDVPEPKEREKEVVDDSQVLVIKKENFESPPEDLKNTTNRDLVLRRASERTVQTFVNVSEYTLEEISVRKSKRVIRVEARRETKVESKEMYREISIPKEIDESTVSCALNQSGILRIMANRATGQLETSSGKPVSMMTGYFGNTGNFHGEIHALGYKPEEIQVNIGNGMITVVGTQEQRPENGFRTRSFTKKIKIPLFIKPDSIVWALNEATGSLDIWSK